MPDNKVYIGDIGTVILLDTAATLTGGTVTIKYEKPDGSTGSWNGTIATSASGANKGISYTTTSGDLNQPGLWKLQAYAVLSGGTWSGVTVPLIVYPAFG
jgi:hypothetical protein